MAQRLVYCFGQQRTEGGRDDRALLGGKGANLAEMTRIGVPVPPGFTITTTVCQQYLRDGALPGSLASEVEAAVRRLEQETGKRFGDDAGVPLLVSVRSGAAASMPGMMDTILNLGLNDRTVAALAAAADNEQFAYDSYRRFLQMYGEVVLSVESRKFERLLREARQRRGVASDTELSAGDLRQLVAEFKTLIRSDTGADFPDEPEAQLWGAIEAVFRSWNNERAIHYRRVNGIPHDLGTAVSVVAMVYGNMGEDSGTGVAFTRHPATGEAKLFGEFLQNAQGEDVVAGTRDPVSVDVMAQVLPRAYAELCDVAQRLERHYRDAQDIEFTVERGQLYLLQTRAAKRTAAAAVRMAVEMVDEGRIDERDALLRIDAAQIDQLLHPQIDPAASITIVARGLPASPGAESGRVVFDPRAAVDWSARGEPVLLVREETSPDDFEGMVASRGILTARGGMTSHAAVVARGMGMCCIVGAREIEIDHQQRVFHANGRTVAEGDWLTLDGTTGRVLAGKVPTVAAAVSKPYQRLMRWADDHRRLGVRANADTGTDASRAREYGAQGIGLCRTEHMFFQDGRIDVVREMILAGDAAGRRAALDRLLPMQRDDFREIFRAMDGLPVTIRLLDPPLHEFLPSSAAEIAQLAERMGMDARVLAQRVERLREANPMLGHRGVRLAISYPEIAEMQTRAIFEAAVDATRHGIRVVPEVMIPLVGFATELERQVELVRRVAEEVLASAQLEIRYLVGTMIEVPRAALTAAAIARHADFFSFGTNDLTQTTLGISRDDAGSFLPGYIDAGVIEADPFRTLDRAGVGQLVETAIESGLREQPQLKIGICGEHGGDPRSIEFFHACGMDYVSCSPYRVPIARLAAAQAALREEQAEPVATEKRRAARHRSRPSTARGTQPNADGRRRTTQQPHDVPPP
ncbi:MAG: pyruvate, phosphate dikinase [Longimicrobiales bacterium]